MPLTVQDILNVWNQIKVEKKKSCKLCPWLKAVKQQRLNESTWTNSRAAMLNVNASSWNILSCCATIVYKDANNGIAMFSHLLRSCSPGFNYGPLISPEVSSSQRDVSLIEKTHTNKYRSNAPFSAHTHTQTPTNTHTHIYRESQLMSLPLTFHQRSWSHQRKQSKTPSVCVLLWTVLPQRYPEDRKTHSQIPRKKPRKRQRRNLRTL